MSLLKDIVEKLPYGPSFNFVDGLTHLDEEGCEGFYTFREDHVFYRHHFKDHPVTPGVMLTECMAQIGLACLGIYLVGDQGGYSAIQMAFSENQVVFERAVYPNEKVKVISKKSYWRLGKLKCYVEMYNSEGLKVCYGTLAGMVKKK